MAREFGDLELGYLKRVLDSGVLGWAEGHLVTEFEDAFKEVVGARHAIARNSAMTGLVDAVMLAGAGVADEVICDPLVQFGGIAALANNSVPVFADVRTDTYLLDPESVRAAITPRTKAIIVTNLWGLCAELDALRQIADATDVILIEDCAHTMYAHYREKHAGTWGHIGVFSFQQGKHLPTGDGSMLVTDSDEIGPRLRDLQYWGESPQTLMLNHRMNEMTAAVGLGQLQRVRGYVEEYTANLARWIEEVERVPWLRNRRVPEDCVQAGYQFACTFEPELAAVGHDRFKAICKEAGAPLGFGFTERPAYLYEFFQVPWAYGNRGCPTKCPWYAERTDYGYREGLCPIAEEVLPRLVTAGVMGVTHEEMGDRIARFREAVRRADEG
jgi:dTDP-4-amino-4,6-dideoxygalactose transaminase